MLTVVDNTTYANTLEAGSGVDWVFFTDTKDKADVKPTDGLSNRTPI
jgi:hypothetical protein